MKKSGMILFFMLMSANAQAFYCSKPSEPYSSVPTAPYCGNLGDLSDCEQWDIDRFKNAINSYIEEMREYAEEAEEYANCFLREAQEHAQEEIDEATRAWNRFARGY